MSLTPKRRVFLDPDGTSNPWLFVVIQSSTGVIYEHQCDGTACDTRVVEGYLVPLGGLKFDANAGFISTEALTAQFHEGKSCCGYTGRNLPNNRMELLKTLITEIPYFATLNDERIQLKVDESRINEIAEGWIPVLTSDGPGILVWDNCD